MVNLTERLKDAQKQIREHQKQVQTLFPVDTPPSHCHSHSPFS